MEEVYMVNDLYSDGVIGIIVMERIWSKISGYLDNKKKDERMDDFGERISKMEGYMKAKH